MAARKGCSKCKKVFDGAFGEKRDYFGFDKCESRSNQEHRREAQETLNQSTIKERQEVESKYGTRYTELMRLPYFDCVRFTIVDPMHNLFLGSAKHIMQNVWLSGPNPLLNDDQLKKIQDKVDTQGQRGFWDWGSGTPDGELCEPSGTQNSGPRTPRCPCV